MVENVELNGVTYHPGRGGFGGATPASEARALKRHEAHILFHFILGYVLRSVCVSLMAALRACDNPIQQIRSFHINRIVAIALKNPPDEARMAWDFPFVFMRGGASQRILSRASAFGETRQSSGTIWCASSNRFCLDLITSTFTGLETLGRLPILWLCPWNWRY